jgi:OmpA-OmpF porin, OOP family
MEAGMLRRILTIGASGLAMAIAAGSAAATPKGWYLGLSGGVSIQDDASFVVTPPGGPGATIPVEFDTGWAVMGAVGYRWDSNWRLEFELAFRQNDWEQTVGGTNTGDISQFSQMVNLAYDFELTDRLNLSLGAGIGGSLVSFDTDTSTAALDDDYVLAGQLMAGLSYQVSRRMELFLDYRYFVTDDPGHSFTFAGLNRELAYDNTNHTVMIGLRYDLTPDAEPVQTYVAPPQPPAPPPVAKQFIVFFGWNKSNLTSQAQSTVAQAAATAKQIGAASILVVGHTDTSGGARYNQKLSERRANTVANELVRNGITPESISAMGKGETELLIQTGDGMREPQNRRVEINL